MLELGICPAATESSLDRINNGYNSGRICWLVSGTFCDGELNGIFAGKSESCLQCDFLQIVMDEEGVNFKLRETLIKESK